MAEPYQRAGWPFAPEVSGPWDRMDLQREIQAGGRSPIAS
jgi:hypothetical protein